MSCAACSQIIANPETAINCANQDCILIHHITCTNLLPEEADIIIRKNIYWFCNCCVQLDNKKYRIIPNRLINPSSTIEKSIDQPQAINIISEKLNELSSEAVPAIASQILKTLENLQSFKRNCNTRFDELEREQKRCNIEINGIPYKHTENLRTILESVCQLLEVPDATLKIIEIKRVRSWSNSINKPIIVKFSNYHTKELILSRAKSSKSLLLSSLGFESNLRFFVNEHLTLEKKKILFELKRNKNQIKFNRLWVKQGNIFIRINGQSLRVHNLDSMFNLLQNGV